jgi:hypothetical protein
MRMLGRVDRDHTKQRRRLLFDGNALTPHVFRQAGECHLHPIVDVDGIDVRIGAELERRGERVAAIVAAHALPEASGKLVVTET